VKWAAGKAVLVTTGDMIDKGNQSVRVLLLFRALQADAARHGGRVIATTGNHEVEFLARPTNRKAVEFVKDLATRNIKPDDVAAGRDEPGLGTFLHGLPFAARVGDCFFAHAGDTRGLTLARLKAELQRGVSEKGYGAGVLLDADGLLEARSVPHPWWEAGTTTPQDAEKRLRRYAEALGVKHFVLGHVPAEVVFADGTRRKAGEMFTKFDGLLFLIDVGMCRAVGYSSGAVLHIHYGKEHVKAHAIDAESRRRLLWEKK
jgi:hypothetical protein